MKKKKFSSYDIIHNLATSKYFYLGIIFGVIDIVVNIIVGILDCTKGVDLLIIAALVLALAVSSYQLYILNNVRLSFINGEGNAEGLRKLPLLSVIASVPMFLTILSISFANTEASFEIYLFVILFLGVIFAIFDFIYYRAIRKTVNYALSMLTNKPSGKTSKLLRSLVVATLVINSIKLFQSTELLSLLSIFGLASNAMFLYILITFDNPLAFYSSDFK
ncbi:MAG: hypothetical protein IKK70_00265 [Clostridia bacterium]|nr:hypothetical protein [Clostridia bacterium]